jgi:hypothetical protein
VAKVYQAPSPDSTNIMAQKIIEEEGQKTRQKAAADWNKPAPETLYTVIVNFDSVYNTAPAMQRLRGSLGNYGPAREYDSLMKDNSPAAIETKTRLKILIRSKMNSIVYECKNLIYKTIKENWKRTRMICDAKGKFFISAEADSVLHGTEKAIIRPSYGVQDVTGRVIEILR